MSDIEQARKKAHAHVQRGELEEAKALYTKILAADKVDAQSWFMLGLVNGRLGAFGEAAECCRKTIDIRPDHPDAYYNLGQACRNLGQHEAAIAAYRQALHINPRMVAVLRNLGLLLGQADRYAEAIRCYRDALDVAPEDFHLYYELGNVLQAKGALDNAMQCYRKAVDLNPRYVEAYCNLGNACQALGRLDAAAENYRRALQIRPDVARIHNNLGIVHAAQGKLQLAIADFQAALRLEQHYPEAFNNLGNAYFAQGQLGDAAFSYQKALALDPGYHEARSNLGNAYFGRGLLEEARENYLQAMTDKPNYPTAHSNALGCLNYRSHDPQYVYDEHKKWSQCHEHPADAHPVHRNSPDQDRRLRVAYVSADLRAHSVSYFLEPLLANHNPNEVETYCYSDVLHQDETTSRLRSLSDHWRTICGMSTDQVDRLIQSDRIDVLVDLAGHSAGNRLRVFALKPAPVQVSYLGYPNTTGLSSIDYRLTDALADPEDDAGRWYTETLVRLPNGFICYQPPRKAPPVSPLPAPAAGKVVFGSFNSVTKITPEVIGLWARILRAVSGSSLMLKHRALHDDSTCVAIRSAFRAHGISEERLDLLGWLPGIDDHLSKYGAIDIALDTFPYNGTTTTCEASWMGVPVVAMNGSAHVARVGVSILSRLGLHDWVACDPDAYVEKAVYWANNLDELKELRAKLRPLMSASALCDAPSFSREVEDAYREMWRSWCRHHPRERFGPSI